MKFKDYSSDEDNKSEKTEVLLTPISEYVTYDENIFKYGIDKKLNPIGHPDPGVGSYYNCHGWTLGYKEWINIKYKRNSEFSLEEQLVISCKEKGVTEDEIFTKELYTYAKAKSTKIIQVSVEDCKIGAIATYYDKDNNLTHTARYKESLLDKSLVWSSKLGDGHVVEHKNADDLVAVYGETIDFYNIDL
jgi:hypothetical protein